MGLEEAEEAARDARRAAIRAEKIEMERKHI